MTAQTSYIICHAVVQNENVTPFVKNYYECQDSENREIESAQKPSEHGTQCK